MQQNQGEPLPTKWPWQGANVIISYLKGTVTFAYVYVQYIYYMQVYVYILCIFYPRIYLQTNAIHNMYFGLYIFVDRRPNRDLIQEYIIKYNLA